MSNIGLSEVIFILILAFIILGPNDLIKCAKTLGILFKKIKNQYNNIHQEINKTIDLNQNLNQDLNRDLNQNSSQNHLNNK